MQVTAQEMDRGELLAHSSSPPHRRVGIQADVFFGCRKLNQILLFPVSRHTPGNLLHSVRQCVFDGIMDGDMAGHFPAAVQYILQCSAGHYGKSRRMSQSLPQPFQLFYTVCQFSEVIRIHLCQVRFAIPLYHAQKFPAITFIEACVVCNEI